MTAECRIERMAVLARRLESSGRSENARMVRGLRRIYEAHLETLHGIRSRLLAAEEDTANQN